MEAVSELIWTASYGSTTIDQICEKADVKKGSFYYFFESKADLALAAIETLWQRHRADLDSVFSSSLPPLERLRQYCAYNLKIQEEIRQKCGCVLGCPLFSVGAEISTSEDLLQKKIQEILEYKRRYLESTLRDAAAAGLIEAPDAASKSRMLFAYYQGLATQARIQNPLDPLRDALQGTYELLGIQTPAPTPA
jgi:TetR/AcrR family transcriptional repressor of nem operon